MIETLTRAYFLVCGFLAGANIVHSGLNVPNIMTVATLLVVFFVLTWLEMKKTTNGSKNVAGSESEPRSYK